MVSLQGRRFSEQTFPSPAHTPGHFKSRSRCLIDLGNSFVVLTEGGTNGNGGDECPPFQRMLFRLEVKREEIVFEDESCITQGERGELLQSLLANLVNCQIVGVDFPFFDDGNLTAYKTRPCVALYSGEAPPLFLAVYSEAPRIDSEDWVFNLSAPTDIGPSYAPDAMVDISKLCGFPRHVNYPSKRRLHHNKSSFDWLADPENDQSRLFAAKPHNLRERIVEGLLNLCNNNPDISNYFDSTIELDGGTQIFRQCFIDGKECIRAEVFTKATPTMSKVTPVLSKEHINSSTQAH